MRTRARLSSDFVAMVAGAASAGALVAGAAGCVAGRASAGATGPLVEGTGSELSASSLADGGNARVCTHDGKDVAPCAEDCDRGLASGCALLAARVEHGDRVPMDLTRAVVLYERARELRDAPSCVSASRMHASGAGVPPSRTRQLDLLSKACVGGDATSCVQAAKAFARGVGVPRDERRAAELWQRACTGGIESACDALGDAGL